jgi:predicted nucleic acid-binding protein
VIPAPVTAEIDYMAFRQGGPSACRTFYRDLVSGRFVVECLTRDEYSLIEMLERRYSALTPGLADLSVVVIAFRLNTLRIATADQRHFRAITPLQGGAFTLLPWDE